MDSKKILVACRSHYCLAYVAFATLADNCNNPDFGHEDHSFSTAYDGGKAYNREDNRMWHFFAELDIQEDGSSTENIRWIAMIGDKAVNFHMPLGETDHTRWPGVTFDKLQELLFSKLHNVVWEQQEYEDASDFLSDKQIAAAKKIERRFFANWGQGAGDLFDGLEVSYQDI